MKKALFLLSFSALLLAACDTKSGSERPTENINQVSLIIDDQLWNGVIGDSLRNKLASPVIGLPQEEPLFTIDQYPVKLLEGYMSNSRNIIVVKKAGVWRFEIRENQYTTPQNVVYISGKTTADIVNILEAHTNEIIQRIRATEIGQEQHNIRKNKLSDEVLRKKFGILLDIPADYKYVMQRRKFVWIKKEITSGSTSIIAYTIPEWILGKHPDVDQIIKLRDSIGKRYIHGTRQRTDMVTENSYTPYFSRIGLNGHPTTETRGTWELNNDFMSGPFLNYCLYDAKNRRYVILEGFCYAPSREKRDLMFELEAALKSVRFSIKKKYGN